MATKHHSIEIAGRKIGQDYPCFIVAEISANHRQKFEEAVKLIKTAAKAGADAVKLQTATPDLLTINSSRPPFIVSGKDLPKIWRGKNLYQLYKMAYTPWEWYPKLQRVADECGVILFSTPFGIEAVDFLEKMKVPCYKIASYEALDVPLLRKVAATGKPIIISQGFYPFKDVEFSIRTLGEAGANEIAVLYCATEYTNKPRLEDSNLAIMKDIAQRLGVVVGFSDNNGGIEIPTIAAFLGASIIEKHFTLSREEGGLDARFSIEPKELSEMIKAIRKNEEAKDKVSYDALSKETTKKALGKVKYGNSTRKVAEIKKFCRSLFVVKDVKKGEKLTPVNVRSIRPATGLSPKFWDQVIGQRASCDTQAGTPLSWNLITK